jgi:FSR family fosmidomycin resistance protein-like MFS transporter
MNSTTGIPLSSAEKMRVLNSCYAYHFLNDGITFVLPTVMVLLFNKFGLTWLESGTVFSMNLLSTIVFQMIMGYYSDILDQKKIMLVGMILLGTSTLLMALSFNLSSLLIFATMLGLGLGIQHASSYSISARIMTEKVNRQSAFGDAGKGIAILASTMLLFFMPGDASWRGAFIIWGVTTLGAAGLIAVKLKQYHLFPSGYLIGATSSIGKYISPRTDNENRRSTLRKIAGLAGFFMLFLLYNAQFQVISNNLTTYMAEYKGFDARVAPFFFVVFFAFAVTGSFSSLPLSRRFPKKQLVMVNYLVYLVILLLYVLIDPRDATWNAIFLAAMAFVSYTIYPVILQITSGNTPRSYLGLVFGITMGLGWIGGFITSFIGGLLSDMFTAQAIFYISITAVIMSMLVLWRIPFA